MTDLVTMARATLRSLIDGARDRVRDERGALSIEYVGLAIFVIGLVAAILALNLDDAVKTALCNAANSVLGGGAGLECPQ